MSNRLRTSLEKILQHQEDRLRRVGEYSGLGSYGRGGFGGSELALPVHEVLYPRALQGACGFSYNWQAQLEVVRSQVKQLDEQTAHEAQAMQQVAASRPLPPPPAVAEKGPYDAAVSRLTRELKDLRDKREERERRLRELQEVNADHLQEFRRRQARLAAPPAQQACQAPPSETVAPSPKAPTAKETPRAVPQQLPEERCQVASALREEEEESSTVGHGHEHGLAMAGPTSPPMPPEMPYEEVCHMELLGPLWEVEADGVAGHGHSLGQAMADPPPPLPPPMPLERPDEEVEYQAPPSPPSVADGDDDGLAASPPTDRPVLMQGWLMVADSDKWCPRWCKLVEGDVALRQPPLLLLFLSDHHTTAVFDHVILDDAIVVAAVHRPTAMAEAAARDARPIQRLRAERYTFEVRLHDGSCRRLFQAENSREVARWTFAMQCTAAQHQEAMLSAEEPGLISPEEVDDKMEEKGHGRVGEEEEDLTAPQQGRSPRRVGEAAACGSDTVVKRPTPSEEEEGMGSTLAGLMATAAPADAVVRQPVEEEEGMESTLAGLMATAAPAEGVHATVCNAEMKQQLADGEEGHEEGLGSTLARLMATVAPAEVDGEQGSVTMAEGDQEAEERPAAMAVTVRTVRGPPRSTTTTLTARQERDVRPSLTSAAEEGPAPAMVKVPEPPPDNTPGLLAVTVRTVRATTVAPHEPRQHQPHAAGGERAYEHGGHKGHRPQQQAVTFREEPAMLSPSSPEQGVWRELLMSPRSPIAVLTTVSPFGDTGDDAAETAGPDDDAAPGGVASRNLLLPVGYETTSSAISGHGAGALSLEWIGVLVSRRRPVMEGPLSICAASTAWQREMLVKYFRLYTSARSSPFLCCYPSASAEGRSLSGLLSLHLCTVQSGAVEEGMEGYHALEIVRPDGISLVLHDKSAEVIKTWVSAMRFFINDSSTRALENGAMTAPLAVLQPPSDGASGTVRGLDGTAVSVMVDDRAQGEVEELDQLMSTVCSSTWVGDDTLGDFRFTMRGRKVAADRAGPSTLRDFTLRDYTMGEFKQHTPVGPGHTMGRVFSFGGDVGIV